ncbi:acyl carrier protein [Paenibacillus silvae]|uniref:acyl carrier protein n=1 Tax=Paenibacillus silvae TaxID=1325358 RepID=UPI001E59CD18|nr:acyl carrier protein [Paenibacillus silvae]
METEIIRIIKEEMEVGVGVVISSESKFYEIGLDSIGLMTLFIHIEEKFNIQFGEDFLLSSNLSRIQDIVEYVENILRN